MMKRSAFVILAGVSALLLWFVWPLFGYVSNSYTFAQLPFGWTKLPDNAPQSQVLYDPRYTLNGDAALAAIANWRRKIGSPSISAAIAIDDQLVWAGSSGWQNVAMQAPATPRTRYRIGSTSKSVTATALARLVAAGKLDLDTPISTYMPNLPNKNWPGLTARQLASHTAGMPGYENNTDWQGMYESLVLRRHFDDPEQAVQMFDGTRMLFTPGADFFYSSYDVVLLSAVMQAVAGKPYLEMMADEVFTPLALTSIGPDEPVSINNAIATHYQRSKYGIKPWRKVDLSLKLAAGGFVATPSDVAVLGASWQNDDFIQAAVREDFWTPVRLKNGKVNRQDYALGWRRKNYKITDVGMVLNLNHGGISKGSQCWLIVMPDYNISIAISMNARTDAFFAFADLYEDVFREFLPAPKADAPEL